MVAYFTSFPNYFAYVTMFLFQRNPETGEEPNDIDLWMYTHSKNGKWSNLASQDVYVSMPLLMSI